MAAPGTQEIDRSSAQSTTVPQAPDSLLSASSTPPFPLTGMAEVREPKHIGGKRHFFNLFPPIQKNVTHLPWIHAPCLPSEAATAQQGDLQPAPGTGPGVNITFHPTGSSWLQIRTPPQSSTLSDQTSHGYIEGIS